ncbi:MAG: stage II sporulation protein R [Clostridiales bacterium]|jgi:stage II sporulation protein R|nr:stage II sporulation protein R [Clostridiales bacterium]
MVYIKFKNKAMAIKNWAIKDKALILAAVVCAVALTLCMGLRYSDKVQSGIADKVIRFHVLANSDSIEDQALKLKVRDGVLAAFEGGLSEAESASETRAFIEENLGLIAEEASKILAENGSDYQVEAMLSHDYFPTKSYSGVTFPAGEYEALRVIIGEGEGKNWWCVMFPPLCFVDVAKGKTADEGIEKLATVATAGEFQLLSDDSREKQVSVNIKFKLIEWFQSIFRKPSQKANGSKESKGSSYVLTLPKAARR